MPNEPGNCSQCGNKVVISADEAAVYEQLGAVPRTDCARCITKQHFAFWIFGKFRKGKSDLSGEPLITVIPEDARFPIYTSKEWFSDAWDAMDFGQEYDPSRPFLNQLYELQAKIPRPHQGGENNVACDWCDDVWESKDCYLSRALASCEKVDYSYRVVNVKDSLDCVYCQDTEKAYDCTYCFNCYNLRHSFNCRDSMDGAFLYDCRNVKNCFMSWNLRGKQYYIRNQPYSKEDYFKELEKYDLGSRMVIADLRAEYASILKEKAVHRENFNLKAEKSFGNYLSNCFNCQDCFNLEDSKDCYNVARGLLNKGCIDTSGTWQMEGASNVANLTGGSRMKYSSDSMHCHDCEYIDRCMTCGDCFGCVGLKNKNYCILNRQYSKEEYERLKTDIVESMRRDGSYGRFLQYRFAPWGYNVSTARFYWPRTKEEVEAMGSFWSDVSDPAKDGISPEALPDNISEVGDEVTKQPLNCPQSGYRFNIAPRELAFYRAIKAPLPVAHFDVRLEERLRQISIMDPYKTNCTYCGKEIDAFYAPEWGYSRIACVECYQREIN